MTSMDVGVCWGNLAYNLRTKWGTSSLFFVQWPSFFLRTNLSFQITTTSPHSQPLDRQFSCLRVNSTTADLGTTLWGHQWSLRSMIRRLLFQTENDTWNKWRTCPNQRGKLRSSMFGSSFIKPQYKVAIILLFFFLPFFFFK